MWTFSCLLPCHYLCPWIQNEDQQIQKWLFSPSLWFFEVTPCWFKLPHFNSSKIRKKWTSCNETGQANCWLLSTLTHSFIPYGCVNSVFPNKRTPGALSKAIKWPKYRITPFQDLTLMLLMSDSGRAWLEMQRSRATTTRRNLCLT
jgi:hypothetical protein